MHSACTHVTVGPLIGFYSNRTSPFATHVHMHTQIHLRIHTQTHRECVCAGGGEEARRSARPVQDRGQEGKGPDEDCAFTWKPGVLDCLAFAAKEGKCATCASGWTRSEKRMDNGRSIPARTGHSGACGASLTCLLAPLPFFIQSCGWRVAA